MQNSFGPPQSQPPGVQPGDGAPLSVPPVPPPWPAGVSLPVPNVLEGPVVSILDRKVVLPSEGARYSLYELCRSWVQNNPDLDQMTPPEQPPTLPRLEPFPPELDVPAPIMGGLNYENPEVALLQFKQHWVRVRQHFQEQDRVRTQHVAPRLQAVLAANPPALPQPLPPHLLGGHYLQQAPPQQATVLPQNPLTFQQPLQPVMLPPQPVNGFNLQQGMPAPDMGATQGGFMGATGAAAGAMQGSAVQGAPPSPAFVSGSAPIPAEYT